MVKDLTGTVDIPLRLVREEEARVVALRARTKSGYVSVDDTGLPLRTLKGFVHKARCRKRHNELLPEQIARLDALGIDWNPLVTDWEASKQDFVRYVETHGHAPASKQAEPRIYTWITRLRLLRKRNVMSEQRIQELDAIGFPWTPPTRTRLPLFRPVSF